MTASAPRGDRAQGPLAHLTVLDLTQHLSGPYATQILGDLGARIIKVEPPAGDPTRRIGPYFEDGDSAYYLSANRNKESVTLDLRKPGGADALLALAARADVVVENFRPGKLDALQIGFDRIAAANPRVVLCSISGFGQDGPYRQRPAFDIIVQGLAGGMSLTGEPGGHPVRSGLPIGDVAAGMYGVIGALAGLAEVARTGRASRVDVAMLDTQVSLMSYVASYYLASGEVAGLQGRGHMSIPTYRAFTCGDGNDVVVAANTQPFWEGLARAAGEPGLIDEERFADNESRRLHRADLDARLEAAFSGMNAATALERLAHEGVPSAPINAVDEALADPQVVARDMIVPLAGRGGGMRAVGNPIKFPDGRTRYDAPPRLGADTRRVLRDVGGLGEDEIERLAEAGTIAPEPPAETTADDARAAAYA